MKTAKQLREERAKLINDARGVLDSITPELPAERQRELESRYDQLMADADKVKVQLERVERQEQEERDLGENIERRAGREDRGGNNETAQQRHAEQYRDAFRAFICNGAEGCTPEQRQILRLGATVTPEMRAMSLTVGAGGYTVPQGFSAELIKALKAFGGVREAARVMGTDTGNTLPMPTVNNTGNKAVIVSEGSQTTSSTDPTFGQVSLGAFTYRSLILVSIELLQDSAFNMDTEIPGYLSEQLFRGLNEHLTTGNGTTQPNGVLTAAVAGATAGAAATIATNDLIELVHSVNRAYRARSRFMLNDTTIKEVRKLKDGQGLYIWQPSAQAGQPDRIFGYEYTVNDDMADIGASAKSVAFGDFSKYICRDVNQMQIMRLTERYADYGQVGFLLFSRHDGDLAAVVSPAAVAPIKYLQHQSA